MRSSWPRSASQRRFRRGRAALRDLPPLSDRDLAELIDIGLVREADNARYYVFRSTRATSATSATSATRRRIVRTFIFWLIILLIPILGARDSDDGNPKVATAKPTARYAHFVEA